MCGHGEMMLRDVWIGRVRFSAIINYCSTSSKFGVRLLSELNLFIKLVCMNKIYTYNTVI